jgi:hypothetical protein
MTTPTYVQEYSAITAVLNEYIDGGAKADSAIMRPAFSEQATIFGIEDGKLSGGPIEILFKTIDTAFRPSPEARAVIAASTSSAPPPAPAWIPTTSRAFASPTSSTC